MTVSFETSVWEHVLHRFGGDVEALEAALPVPKSAAELAAVSDDRLLSDLSRRIFRAGLKHSLVDAKWPAFERACKQFQPHWLAALSDEQLEALMQSEGIIRHWGKIKALRDNAAMVMALSAEHGGFGRFLADWPVTDIVGLWRELQRRGRQLGGRSAQAFLRMVGKDTFLLTSDVVAALIGRDVIDRTPTARRDLEQVQRAFNDWHEQTGRPLCQLSRLLSMTANY